MKRTIFIAIIFTLAFIGCEKDEPPALLQTTKQGVKVERVLIVDLLRQKDEFSSELYWDLRKPYIETHRERENWDVKLKAMKLQANYLFFLSNYVLKPLVNQNRGGDSFIIRDIITKCVSLRGDITITLTSLKKEIRILKNYHENLPRKMDQARSSVKLVASALATDPSMKDFTRGIMKGLKEKLQQCEEMYKSCNPAKKDSGKTTQAEKGPDIKVCDFKTLEKDLNFIFKFAVKVSDYYKKQEEIHKGPTTNPTH